MKYIIAGLIGVLVIAMFFLVVRSLDYGLTKTEINECIKWNSEAKTYEGYYYTEWQIEQCIAVGFPLDPIN